MSPPSQILRTLRTPAAQERVAGIIGREHFASRRALGRRVCEEFGFRDRRGAWQLASCLKALNTVAFSGGLVLPCAHTAPVRSSPSLLVGGVPAPVHVPSRLEQVRGLSVLLVTDRAHRRVWNTLIAEEHPQGMTIFAGRQLRYLVASAHGWLGAVGFSASALHLAARERWMGWSAQQREAHRGRVTCLSRFLVRPGVTCANLASHVLGQVLRRVAGDFQDRYAERPWLVETFVNPDYDGACLKAANFVAVGRTAGRGRQDRGHGSATTVKSVYLYELDRRWRRRLGVSYVDPAPVRHPGAGLGAQVWAAQEFGGAPLGDQRLTARLIKSATLLAQYPGRAISANVKSDAAAVDGFYRFVEQPQTSPVTVRNILAPHRERTIERMRSQEVVLAVQDGTDLSFKTRPGCEGLEVVGTNQTGATTLGLHLHATLAVNAQGLPLGVLRCRFDTDTGAGVSAKRKTSRWIEGLHDIANATRSLTRKTRVVSVCDREGDFFELFDEQRRAGRVELLVRAKHDRYLAGRRGNRPKLFATLSAGEPAGHMEVELAPLTERPKSSGKKARPGRNKRLARCELRFCTLTLPATIDDAEPVPLTGVHLLETHPPEHEPAVQWYLLTTLPVTDAHTAATVVGYYLQRWRVEDFFRVLKSGCRVEFLLFRSAHRLQRAIAINAVIAWRIMLMTLLGRQVPECEAGLMFSDEEIHFLRDYAHRYRAPAPDHHGAAVRLVAHLGGYRDRTHDPEPGTQIMWHGYHMLTSATLGHQIGFEAGKKHGLTSG